MTTRATIRELKNHCSLYRKREKDGLVTMCVGITLTAGTATLVLLHKAPAWSAGAFFVGGLGIGSGLMGFLSWRTARLRAECILLAEKAEPVAANFKN